MSEFKLPDSLKEAKKQDIKDSAKRIVTCAIEHGVEIKITYDEKENNYVYFSWGKDEFDHETAKCLCLDVPLDFHKKTTNEIIEKIKKYTN